MVLELVIMLSVEKWDACRTDHSSGSDCESAEGDDSENKMRTVTISVVLSRSFFMAYYPAQQTLEIPVSFVSSLNTFFIGWFSEFFFVNNFSSFSHQSSSLTVSLFIGSHSSSSLALSSFSLLVYSCSFLWHFFSLFLNSFLYQCIFLTYLY